MPKPVFHLWIASQLAEQDPSLYSPDFFLGHIAPDAALSRKDPPADFKNITHLARTTEDKSLWTRSVKDYYASLPTPTLFDLGFCMHIITDIEFRKFMRSYYDQFHVPSTDRDVYDEALIPLLLQQLFNTPDEYQDCVRLAQASTLTCFPFSLTQEDMEANIRYAADAYPESDTGLLPLIPVPDGQAVGGAIIEVLRHTF